jgi:outer membrane cobalamin receptor
VSVSLHADVPLSDAVALRASVSNLLDAAYEPVQGFPAPGRAFWLELTVRH